MASDALFMQRALFLAGRGRGQTTPNPMVGSVVVSSSGRVVGAGFHPRAGEPHAEVLALREAGPAARGATLYCTLEPCCHHGRTPPCVEQIAAAGVARVVAAVQDPNPKVAGRGFQYLRERGIVVDVGEGEAEAVRLNRPFFMAMTAGRPWVIAKAALSADGHVAAHPGRRTALSSGSANRCSQLHRAEVDAIGVGIGTILADDPVLTCRDVYRGRPLVRVVFDRQARTPPDGRLLGTLDQGPVVVVTASDPNADGEARATRLESAGARVLAVPGGDLVTALRALLPLQVLSLLLEGGPGLQRAAWQAGVVDAVRVIVTPRMLGPGGVPWLSAGEVSLSGLSGVRVVPLGPDVLIEGDVYRTH